MTGHRMAAADVARKHKGKPIAGGQYLCQCPVTSHGRGRGDVNPSLTVADCDRGLVVHCKAGCDPVEVLKALGYERQNGKTSNMNGHARPPEASKPYSDHHLIRDGYHLVTAYDYVTETGELLYQVLRYEHPTRDKTFLQRRPDGKGGWLFGGGNRKILYRQNDRAKFGHTTAYVTEGEKDADRLAGLGLLAVTVASGAWSREAIEALRGYDCFILEDNDEPGRKRSNKAAEALDGVASSVRIVRLPGLAEGEDVSDWLDHGGDSRILGELCQSGPTDSKVGPEGVSAPIRATPFTWIDPRAIPSRQFIYGRHLIRHFLSTTIAHGGVGKSALEIVEALAMVSGKPLLGIQPKERLRVWYWNGEDPLEELQRRIMAAAVHYGLTPDDLGDRLYIDSGRRMPIIIAEQTRDGAKIASPVVDAVIETIRANRIDAMIVDPFVSSHRVTENDNNAIEAIAKKWSHIADLTACATELSHHSRKTGGAEVTVEDGRGAVALLAAARSARVLNVMSDQEASKAGVENRKWYFRVDSGKANLTPPAEKAEWFRFVSVDLANGDNVGVPTPWRFPNPLDDVTVADLRAAQKAVSEGGPYRESKQAKDWVGKPIAAALQLNPDNKADIQKITGLLKVWIENDMFRRVDRQDPKRRDTRTFIEVGQWAND